MFKEELDTGRLAYEVLSQYLLENDRPGKPGDLGKPERLETLVIDRRDLAILNNQIQHLRN